MRGPEGACGAAFFTFCAVFLALFSTVLAAFWTCVPTFWTACLACLALPPNSMLTLEPLVCARERRSAEPDSAAAPCPAGALPTVRPVLWVRAGAWGALGRDASVSYHGEGHLEWAGWGVRRDTGTDDWRQSWSIRESESLSYSTYSASSAPSILAAHSVGWLWHGRGGHQRRRSKKMLMATSL